MRVGMNPMRRKVLAARPKVVAAVIVHLPELRGYHEQRLVVVQASLTTLHKNAGCDVHVLVWDNGSCQSMRDWLTEVYQPDTLILSENVGKANAQASIARMLPPETIVAYADDDMYYYPGWLVESLNVLDAYPPAVVTANPTRRAFGHGTKKTMAWADWNARVTYGQFVKDEWEKDYCTSTGVTKMSPHLPAEALIEFNGVEALATSHHCQFVTRAREMVRFTEFADIATRNELAVDESIDDMGILRLCTRERYTRHIGNVMDRDLAHA